MIVKYTDSGQYNTPTTADDAFVAYVSQFIKHGIEMPSWLSAIWNFTLAQNPLGTRAIGAAASNADGWYLFPVQFGAPLQTLQLLFDTGSSDLYVRSWLLPDSLKG